MKSVSTAAERARTKRDGGRGDLHRKSAVSRLTHTLQSEIANSLPNFLLLAIYAPGWFFVTVSGVAFRYLRNNQVRIPIPFGNETVFGNKRSGAL
ncbi:MAG: hypothetical protein ACU0A6_18390 [Shimia sp.]|uniref:hypothetical protein n=1 Tax=Shimia sp. TaxID=1954381 RepID=UPI004059AABF